MSTLTPVYIPHQLLWYVFKKGFQTQLKIHMAVKLEVFSRVSVNKLESGSICIDRGSPLVVTNLEKISR